MRITTAFCFAASVFLFTGAETNSLRIPIQQYTLDNGLRVIVSEDHSAPTYAISVTYNVGSRDEHKGRTGFAHLFEHMMFQGSENVGKGEHFILVLNNGGSMNGTTSQDRTNYFEAFPSNQLDLGLFLEADRMRSLAVNESNLANQRNAVQEEKRLGEDNQPYGQVEDTLNELAYGNFANAHSVIGSMDDLNAATVKDVQDFFRTYYAPNNAVLTLVGDVDPAAALAKVKQYFGRIPRQPAPPVPDLAEAPPSGEKRKTLEDGFARLQRVDVGYRNVPGDTPDDWALSVASEILGDGQSSRLYQALIKEKHLAVNAGSFELDHRGPSLFQVVALIAPGKDEKDVEAEILSQIDRLKNEPVADWELQKARMLFKRSNAQQMRSTLARAIEIGQDTVFYNDPALVDSVEQKIDAVTKEDIQRVARKYLTPENRAVVVTVPKPGAATAAGGPPPEQDKSVPLSQVQRMNKAPVSGQVLHVTLPKPVEWKVPNGLTVLLLEDHRLPTVSARITILGAGAVFEPADMPGLASFTAQMLNQGTAKRTSRQIAEEVEGMGGSISSTAPFGSATTFLNATGLSETFPQLMAVAADEMLHASFPEPELAILKQRQKAQLMQSHSQPRFLGDEVFYRAVYGSHPAAVTEPTLSSIDSITPELMRKWHDERYAPQNSILAIAGDVSAAQVREALGSTLGAWKQTDFAAPQPPASKRAETRKVWLVDRPGSVQTRIEIGNIAVKRTDAEYVPLEVMNRIVGGSPASRLFLNLRENKGYTYGAFSSLTATLFAGPWVASADVRSPVTEGAMAAFMDEIRRIRDEKVPAAELEEAKHALVASFALSLENPAELVDRATLLRIYRLPADYWDTFPEKVSAVTADDVQRVARKYIVPETLQIVAVGDAAKIREGMAKFGPVEVRDAQGKIETTPAAPAGQ